MQALKIRGLRKTYKTGVEALKGIDLDVEKGDFFALLGANGAGKTTMIGIICGLVTKTGGAVEVLGEDIDRRPDEAKLKIGVVPQEFNFSIFEKVIDIVVAQAGFYGIPKHEAEPRAKEILTALGLWDKRDQMSRTLSGGMKRRLMIARALIHQPDFLVLDEPTAGVDVELRIGMWQYLRELNAKGVTILLTTHYLEEAEQLCRNVAIIRQGEIVKQGSMKELVRTLDRQTYSLDVSGPDRLPDLPGFVLRRIDSDTFEADIPREASVTELVNALSAQGFTVRVIRPTENPLERLFLQTNAA